MSQRQEPFDKLDYEIVRLLQEDAWIPISTIAQKVGVANATAHLRIGRLKELGVIRGVHAEIDYSKLGYPLSAFVGIILHQARDYQRVIGLLEQLPEVTEAYYATGSFSIFCKVCVRDIDSLHAFLMKNLQSIKAIQSTQTLVILDAPIRRSLQME